MRTRSSTRLKEGGHAKSEARSLSLCPWYRSQLLTAHRLVSPSPRRGEAADGAPTTSGLPHLVSRVPASRRLSTSCCAPRAKKRVARRSPGSVLLQGTGSRTSSPPARSGHFALSSRRRKARTLTRTSLQLFSKVRVPGLPGIGAELRRPQRQRLRLTSPRGVGRGRRREHG